STGRSRALQPEWLAPASLEEALALKAERSDATVVAGGTFVGILVNQRLLAPTAFLALGGIPDLDRIVEEGGELRLGALATHRARSRKVPAGPGEGRAGVGGGGCRRGARARVGVGAGSGRPQFFPQLCEGDGEPAVVGRAYADAIDPIGDVSGSSDYRRRVIA